MNLLIRIVLTSLLVFLLAYLLKGITVDSISTALIVAVVLGLLNFFVKPILVLFTLPITLFTLGLFYLVINAFIVLLCDKLVDGFSANSFWSALWFSILLSISQSIIYKTTEEKK